MKAQYKDTPLFKENMEFKNSDFYTERERKVAKFLLQEEYALLEKTITGSKTTGDCLKAFLSFKKKTRKMLQRLEFIL